MSESQFFITIDGLKTRFGEPEIISCNDPYATGNLDTVMLNTRIADTHAEIAFYLGMRGLSFTDIKDDARFALLQKIAADLVRATYFQPEPPLAVKEAAMRAREMLKQLAQGQLDPRALPQLATIKQGGSGGQHVR
ncbi:MAG: DUF1320 domain-containing protein [Alphaproteobacteria bacterium]|nr:DUF1320 domain-containing protein [Alphaproteobacteria bacterium]